jgi:hypothetical protein
MADQVNSSVPSSAPVQDNSPTQESGVQSPQVNAQTGAPNTQQPLPGSMGGNKPPVAGQPTVAQKEAIRKHKLKIDGREEELPEDEVIKWAQLGRASQKRFQEASATRKQAEDFIQMLKTDPRKVLSDPSIGVDLRKFSEEYLSEQLKLESLTPEQRQIRDMQEQLKANETEKKQAAETRRQEEFQKATQHYTQEYETGIMDAISSSGLPRTPYIVKRMTDYMSSALQNGLDLEPKNVVELVRQDYITDTNALYGQLDGDTLLKILGDGVANKIRKADLARIRNLQNQPPAVPGSESSETVAPQQQPSSRQAPKPAPTSTKMNVHEWREMMAKKK